jgi:glucose/arabinose dehydrogenase
MNRFFTGSLAVMFTLACASVQAADLPIPKESDYYKITDLPIPAGVVLEVGSVELLPGKILAASSRRGDIYLVENPFTNDPKTVRFTKFASGLHEVLGLAYRDGWLYATQRGEMTRIKDSNGDKKADIFETVSDSWEINGDYHEYAFGSKFDKEGNLWVALCLTGSFTSDSKYRGWAFRITPDGKSIPTTVGLRSPGGMGMNAEGDMFYTENQGPWNGACALKHLKPGAFVGHPDGLRWYEESKLAGKKPATPTSGSRMAVEAKKIPELLPPAVYFPYPKMGQSASGIVCDTTSGKFGPFQGQMFVGDQSASTVMRVVLEKVKGRYQGACIPFRSDFGSGNLAMLMNKDGSLFVGGTNRGWGSRGGKPYSLERLNWTGKVPFEIHTVSAKKDGFKLTFTKPVDKKTALDPKSYRIRTHTYIYQASYGSPEVDETNPTVTSIKVADDGLSAEIQVSQLVEGHVHELHADGLRSTESLPLLHADLYYTMNTIPE